MEVSSIRAAGGGERGLFVGSSSDMLLNLPSFLEVMSQVRLVLAHAFSVFGSAFPGPALLFVDGSRYGVESQHFNREGGGTSHTLRPHPISPTLITKEMRTYTPQHPSLSSLKTTDERRRNPIIPSSLPDLAGKKERKRKKIFACAEGESNPRLPDAAWMATENFTTKPSALV
ncbi:hypothetical protein LY78DRAFT_94866 [Colletotrichum sublineola]|nr:hypothetical protein LY78DRAFT_94866 [Colletotrichum sublineola]